jgi:hypothetical protein
VFEATKDIKRGEEIHDCYGTRTMA